MKRMIPDEARLAADQGNLLEAIKLTREATGLGLREAKEAVDTCVPEGRAGSEVSGAGELPLEAVTALHRGRLIEAVSATRAATGLGMKDAREAIGRYLAENDAVNRQFLAARARGRQPLVRLLRGALLLGALVAAWWWFSGNPP
jgi:ribosomal protein L7/L12